MAITIAVISMLLAIVSQIFGACVYVPNDDMIEYLCENGQPYDLYSIPERTEKIRMSNINLSRITRDMFSRFGDNLWVLALSNCGINDIDPDAFKTLTNLQHLHLDNNHLTTVKASWFDGLKYLTYLDCNYNQIETIEDGVFDNLPSLVDLRISGNKLECLNVDEISRLSDLRRIFLNRNPEFKCPNAISKILEEKQVTFERDPEWSRITEDLVRPGTTRMPYDDWRPRPSSTTPMYRDRITVSRPTESSTPSVNYPTSVSHPIYEDYSTQDTRGWPTSEPSSFPTRPASTEQSSYPTRNWPSVMATRPDDYTPSSPSSRPPYSEIYYPPQVPRSSTHDPYKESGPSSFPTALPTSTARISWSGDSDEVFNETDYPPIETASPVYHAMPTGPPLREDPEDYETSRTPVQSESYPKPHPLENYQQVDEVKSVTVAANIPTTDKPLPKCKNSSTSFGISIGVLIFTIFYSVSRTI